MNLNAGDCVTSIIWAGCSLLLSSRSGSVSFLLPYSSSPSTSSTASYSNSTSTSHPSLNIDRVINSKEYESVSNNSYNDCKNEAKNRKKSNSNLESKYGIKTSMVRSLGFRTERAQDYSPENCRGNDYYHKINGKDNRSLTMGLLCSLPRHLTTSGMFVRTSVYPNISLIFFLLTFFHVFVVSIYCINLCGPIPTLFKICFAYFLLYFTSV